MGPPSNPAEAMPFSRENDDLLFSSKFHVRWIPAWYIAGLLYDLLVLVPNVLVEYRTSSILPSFRVKNSYQIRATLKAAHPLKLIFGALLSLAPKTLARFEVLDSDRLKRLVRQVHHRYLHEGGLIMDYLLLKNHRQGLKLSTVYCRPSGRE